jgi:hypothetical protein
VPPTWFSVNGARTPHAPRLSWQEVGLLLAFVLVISVVMGAWLHSTCHPSGDMWLSASGDPEAYCGAVAGRHSAWLTCLAATGSAGLLIMLAGRRTRWAIAIAAAVSLAAVANLVTFWVVYSNG